MLLRYFYEKGLAQASYLVGCPSSGAALVIDPTRDSERYIAAAGEEELRIGLVAETHIHADFLSGTRELARRSGARILLSGEGEAGWEYDFPPGEEVRPLKGGDTFSVGKILVEVLHTPGHTPEHLSFRVTDRTASESPMGIFTGDFLFAGDVGRPDLLERAAGVEGAMRGAARRLFASIQGFRDQPDHLQIWPGHGAGSACGRSLSAVPQSTLGYEKLVNWAFRIADEEAFVEAALAGQPEVPAYFGTMKRLNRDGPPLLAPGRMPPRMPPRRLGELLREGSIVVDIRSMKEFGARHVPGTLSLPRESSFATWAGWLLPYDRDFHLLAGGAGEGVGERVRDLGLIGLDRVAGYFDDDAIDLWEEGGGRVERAPALTPAEADLAMRSGDSLVIDVREESEWREGHIAGAERIHLGHLSGRRREIPRGRPVILYCRSGKRSAIGQSILLADGFGDVSNLSGGMIRWAGEGREVVGGGE